MTFSSLHYLYDSLPNGSCSVNSPIVFDEVTRRYSMVDAVSYFIAAPIDNSVTGILRASE